MKHEEVFERLSPPAGGLPDLRARITRRAFAIDRFAPFAVAFAACVALLVMFLSRQRPPDLVARAHAHDDGAEMALGLAPVQHEPVEVAVADRGTTVLARVPTSREDVAFYWVGSR